MKFGMESFRGLRYKIMMMKVEISGTLFIYGNNMSVIHSTKHTKSNLNKKSKKIFYRAMRESAAMSEYITENIDTNENIADLATKVLYGGKRKHMIRNILYGIYDHDH